jgi:threonine dehydrogenase-like Zn-dependent dehydrogenase
MRQAVEAVCAGTLNPTPLFTHSFALEGLGDALDLVAQPTEGFFKALIVA